MLNLVTGIMYGVKGEYDEIIKFLQEKFPNTYEEEWDNLVESGHIINSIANDQETLVGYKAEYINTDIDNMEILSDLTKTLTDTSHCYDEKYSSFMDAVFWFYDYPKEYFFTVWR